MQPSFNTWTIIFLVVALHGVIIALNFLIKQEGRAAANRLLGLFILLFSLTLVHYVAYWTKYQWVYPQLMGMSSTFPFLFGPVLYLYLLSIINPERIYRYRNLIHFIPFLLFMAYMMPFYLMDPQEKLELLRFSLESDNQLSSRQLWIATLKIIHLVFYTGLIVWYTHTDRLEVDGFSQGGGNAKRRWLQLVGYCFAGFTISFASYYILIATIDFNIEYDYMISFAMSVFIFAVGYIGLFNPELMKEAHDVGQKYETSSLTEEQAEKYLERLSRYMEQENAYKNGTLRMNEVADELQIPAHHLSQVINEQLDQNFYEFVNGYRIREAEKLLSDPGKRDFKILRVAYESGFNNKTSFNQAFKKRHGITPSSYRKNQINGKG